MHAYLITGNNDDQIRDAVNKLITHHSARLISASITKISDVRTLEQSTMLKTSIPIAFVIEHIENASIEALNAFLKTLEEPGENIYFILTAHTLTSVLPTIASRCTIIKTDSNYLEDDMGAKEFVEKCLDGNIDFLFEKTGSIKTKAEAIEFLQTLLTFIDHVLSENEEKLKLAQIAESIQETVHALEKNGNVKLQLTNFILTLAE